MSKTLSVFFVSLALSTCALVRPTEPIVYTIKLAGTPIGTCETTVASPNEFTEHSVLKVGPQSIDGTLHAKLADGKYSELHFEFSSSGKKYTFDYANKKATLVADGKTVVKDQAMEWDQQSIVDPLFPYAMMKLHDGIAAATPGKPYPFLILSGLTVVKGDFVVRPITVERANGNQTIDLGSFTLNGTEIQVAMSASGEVLGAKVPSQTITVTRVDTMDVFSDPLTKYRELSQPTYKTKTEVGLKTSTPDGAVLVSDVMRPNDDQKHPVILIRTPYGRGSSLAVYGWFAARGYAVVSQDVRGMGDSTGGWDPLNTEVNDGRYTLDWLVAQPWCDGSVGMIGGSYLGYVQWAAAVTHHPALKCIIPQVSPTDPVHNLPWDNGCFMLSGALWWSKIVADKTMNTDAVSQHLSDFKALSILPLNKVDDKVLDRDIPFYNAWLNRPTIQDWPGAFREEQVAKVQIPVMHVSGVWDGDGIGTIMHWNELRAAGGNQWLIFGPWTHAFNTTSKMAGIDYGNEAILELDSVYLRFFDTYLKRRSVKMEDQPRVRMFVSGINHWFNSSDYPMPFTKATKWYLGGGPANSAKSTGTLTLKPTNAGVDHIRYTPKDIRANPSGDGSLIMDGKAFGNKELLYRTDPFRKGTMVTGPFTSTLFVSTTVKDAAFHVGIVDQRPDGKYVLLGQLGHMRVSYANGHFEALKPNQIYRITVEPWNLAHYFAPGHRLCMYVVCDVFPAMARIPGTGEPDATATKLLNATNSIYKFPGRASSFQAYTYSW